MLRSAEDLYEAFTRFEVDHCFSHSYRWPEPQGLFGRALRLGYYSDKFDGEWREYTHAHGEEHLFGTEETTYPAILSQKQPGTKPWGRFFAPPLSGKLAVLGFALDVQVFDTSPHESPQHINWKDAAYIQRGSTRKLPWLLGDASRNLLVIAPKDGGMALLLWSPILRITPRGIIN